MILCVGAFLGLVMLPGLGSVRALRLPEQNISAFLGFNEAHALSAMQITARPTAGNFTLDQHWQLGEANHEAGSLAGLDSKGVVYSPNLRHGANLPIGAENHVAFANFMGQDNRPIAVLALAQAGGWLTAKGTGGHISSCGQFRERLAFLHRDSGDRNERSSDIFHARLFVDLLAFTIVMPDQVLNESRNHPPMLRAHVHAWWHRYTATNGVTVVSHSVNHNPARARCQAQTVLVPEKSAKTKGNG